MYCSSGVVANRSRGALAALARALLEGKFFGLQNQVKTMKLLKKNNYWPTSTDRGVQVRHLTPPPPPGGYPPLVFVLATLVASRLERDWIF